MKAIVPVAHLMRPCDYDEGVWYWKYNNLKFYYDIQNFHKESGKLLFLSICNLF